MYNNYYPYYYRGHNFKRINCKSLLDGTNKTLSVINQAIPVIYQIKPLINNAKTAFKVISAIKNDDNKEEKIVETKKEKVETYKSNSPTYFL